MTLMINPSERSAGRIFIHIHKEHSPVARHVVRGIGDCVGVYGAPVRFLDTHVTWHVDSFFFFLTCARTRSSPFFYSFRVCILPVEGYDHLVPT